MMYLIRHPKEVTAFVERYCVDRRKALGHLKIAGGDPRDYFSDEELAAFESAYQQVKDRYIEVLCERCNITRDRMSWSPLDLASMAREEGILDLVFLAYAAAAYISFRYDNSIRGDRGWHCIQTRSVAY